MKISISILLITCLLVLSSCTLQEYRSNTPNITITPPEKNSIQFTGKGAGAGMMLMSSMGPMGVAVGVAIDVGTGKDIHETAVAGGVDVIDILKTSLLTSLNETPNHGITSLDIKIEKYGFKTTPGENAPCVVDVELSYSINGSEWQAINSGEVYNQASNFAPTRSLEVLKSDAKPTKRLFELFAKELTQHILTKRKRT